MADPVYQLGRPDPGAMWCPDKKLSERLEQIKRQWINLGERQQGMLDNLILSAEYLEGRVEYLEKELANGK